MINLISGSIALIVVLVIFLLICVAIYKTGYTTQTFTAGDRVTLYITNEQQEAGKNVSNFRFKNCTFTLIAPNNSVTTIDVTARLNAIAKQYTSAYAIANKRYDFTLPRPLNIFTFPIQGYTDSATLKANNLTPASFCTSIKTCLGDNDCNGTPAGTSGNMCIKQAYSDPSTVQNGTSICGDASYASFVASFPQSTVKDHTFPVLPNPTIGNYNYTAATPNNAVVCAPNSSGQYQWQLVSQLNGKCAVCESNYKVYLTVNYKII